MAQWLGMHTVLPQGLSLVASAHNKCSQLPVTLAPGKYTTSHERGHLWYTHTHSCTHSLAFDKLRSFSALFLSCNVGHVIFCVS